MSRSPRLLFATLAVFAAAGMTQAAPTDISQVPLITASGTPVKPNVLFILDDSGSMDNNYLPESANFSSTKYGVRSSQCNGLAFNPNLEDYLTPKNADGSYKASASSDAVLKASSFVSSPRAVTPSSPSIQSSGNVKVTVSGSSGSYSIGAYVTLYSSTSPSNWMIGTVSSWTGWSRELTVSVWGANGSGSLTSAHVGSGHPPVVYYTYSGTQKALGYTYSTTGAVQTDTDFYKQCDSTVGSTPGSSVFTRVIVNGASANLQKYANWYAHYRTRMLMMKTVVSHAFSGLDDQFRVGFTTILNTTNTSSGVKQFLPVSDFDAAHKVKFYAALEAADATDFTPLRGALSNAGRYFAKKAPGQTGSSPSVADPVQYSCQRNFSILSTDGAWNTDDETSTYGPFKLDGSPVGQQDGTAADPLRDASSSSGSGGSSNSLADVAMYFYSTDLRTTALGNCTGAMGVDVCANNVKKAGRDTAEWQHMTTFTMSLGQNGTIKYVANYEKQTSGDYFDITQGTKKWPNPSGSASKVDDLWHAAVNGRGTYFNAASSTEVTAGLVNALSEITALTVAGAAASTSTLRPVAGDNQVFVASYTSERWTGDLSAYRLEPLTAIPLIRDSAGNDLAEWRAATNLNARTTERKIYYFKPGTGLRDFSYANLSADGLNGLVDNGCTKTPALSQCATLSSTDRSLANNGANMVSYLRGNELAYYRSRTSKLGDIAGSSPVFVKKPSMEYADSGYASFQSANAGRKGVVYVGANDGMLHAFDAANGNELWAYIPSMVRANMYRLADKNYASNHIFFVNGSPESGDITIGGVWKTILVGGLGAGGRGYYALDITDPDNPKALWEFTDTNLGLSFAQPLITKRANGQWVVVVSSGYNNADGKGHLFVLDAATGTKLVDISTGAGDAANPSGLGPVNAWVDATADNTALRFYAGDLQGNVWRFDIDGVLEPKNAALKLATLRVDGLAQPITTRPQLAEVNYAGFKTPVVYVGTGKMLGLTDMTSGGTQSIYGIKDSLGTGGHGDVRAGTTIVGQTLTPVSDSIRTATSNPVDWSTKSGWYVDLPDNNERINVDMLMQANTVVAVSNVPQSVASCTESGGYSWLYVLDIANGSNVGPNAAKKLDEMTIGITSIVTPTGPGFIRTPSTGNLTKENSPVVPKPEAKGRRSSWRELVDR